MQIVEDKLREGGARAGSQRTAHFVSALCLAWPDGHIEEFEGTVDGTLVWPPRGGCGDLGSKGAREASLVDAGVAHMAVEVAVRTLRQAERPMDIDAERRSVVAISALQDKPPRA